ncbi:ankyrin repeat domain-containing protein [Wolbachia endosymbiont of Brugia malayi]|nr:ankyrin repeat domain-containing protein [Wolbachia endosymbiont of Brugia malayi]AAW70876.1 Ankyrin repeat-containing protein [Wolbachia endosymbiont strain TRS of Brugia malayi]QCB61836.1 ankyrin repeat domain-containing protein [Wolbachia endosymbiont of Brugia malayi]
MHVHKNVVEFFLNQELNISDPDKDGWTSLHYAVQRGCLEVVKFLARKGKSINVENAYGSKPVHRAASGGHKNVVEFFLIKE